MLAMTCAAIAIMYHVRYRVSTSAWGASVGYVRALGRQLSNCPSELN